MSDTCKRRRQDDNGCPCTYPGCPRHGDCRACVKYHREKGQLTACFFTPEEERTFDRSIAYFIACRTQKA